MYIFSNYTKLNLCTISLLLSILIYLLISYTFQNISNAYDSIKDNVRGNHEKFAIVSEDFHEEIAGTAEEVLEETMEGDEEEILAMWQLEIPKIELIGPISEGTDKEVMDEYIGHFENTRRINGNIGLAAHNRGYPVNYFSNLKTLQMGDEIIYRYNDKVKKYMVSVIEVIEDTDWSYLKDTKDNRITLITCVENKPNLRRVIQGFEINQ